jgi:5-oxoprolinase (ATP-hydrolysing) subunit A
VKTDKERNFESKDATESSPLHLWRGVRGEVNCDIGEGAGNDELIMPFINSASIACGWHAGDAVSMQKTIELCLEHKVAIGAHPSFFDKENFGRTDMELPVQEIYELVTQQLVVLNEIAASMNAIMQHVKPHGALYNISARDALTANVIARAVKDFDSHLVLFGLSGSPSISEAKKLGLKTASEVFADRTYRDDGSLTPRSEPNALINETGNAVTQVLQMIRQGTVTTASGKTIPILAETICIHGDGKHAVEFAKAIHAALTNKRNAEK